MIIYKSIKNRLYPNKNQEKLLIDTANACRFVYNHFLGYNIEREKVGLDRLSAFDQIKELTILKKEKPWLTEVPAQPLQQSILDLGKAYKNLREGRAKHPRFHKKGLKNSFRVPQGFKIENNFIVLPKVGKVDWVYQYPVQGKPKNATVTLKAGK